MKVTFVIMSAYGMGGTIRTVVTLANRLAEDGHQVEIISLLRRRPKPFFPIDERVTIRTVLDHRRRRRGRGCAAR